MVVVMVCFDNESMAWARNGLVPLATIVEILVIYRCGLQDFNKLPGAILLYIAYNYHTAAYREA